MDGQGSAALPAAVRAAWSGLPPELAARAAAVAAGHVPAAPTRDAATVVLLRDTPAGMQAYLLRRVATMAFAAGMHVFPGGSVDPRDADLPADAWAGPPPSAWQTILSADSGGVRALVCAAVRETFEESGVLLAGDRAGTVVADVTGADWEADRQALIDRSLSMAELLQRRRLQLRADLLRAWAHWVTPEAEPRRYDTRFFVAALPAGQRTRHVGGEADGVLWLNPADALTRAGEGQLRLLPPTAFTLAELSAYSSVADVLAAGTRRDVRPVMPKVVVEADSARLLLPHDEGYAE